MPAAAVSPELNWAINSAIFTSVLWAPHIVQRIVEMGPYCAFRDPRHDVATRAPWAQRAIRAHTNAVENLVVFGLLAMAVHVLGVGDAWTGLAAGVYFAARVVHYVVYVAGVPWVRTPVYLTGFLAQSVLALRLVGLA